MTDENKANIPLHGDDTLKKTTNIYRIKVTLRHIKPPVWRRIEVPGNVKLPALHEILQSTMGWTNSHLHAFRAGNESYGEPDPDFPIGMRDERSVTLDSIVGEGATLVYEYDFGDGWEHDLKVEKVFPAEQGVQYSRCTKGKRACPPEDCGGPWGYAELIEILSDPEHEDHEEMREWAGPYFEPEHFDLVETNQLLLEMR